MDVMVSDLKRCSNESHGHVKLQGTVAHAFSRRGTERLLRGELARGCY